MIRYWMAIAFGLAGMAGSVHAEPIRWSYSAINHETGEFFGSGSVIWDLDRTFAARNLVHQNPAPFDPPYPDRSFFLGSTTITRLTITDKASGESESGLLKWTLGFPMQYDPDTQTWERWPIYESVFPRPFSGSLRLGKYDYYYGTHGSDVFFYVKPAPIPEPATLLMAGIGLSVVGLIRARRKRANPEQI